MPTLYVENVPEELYSALRNRAREKRTSISAEVMEVLLSQVPDERELTRRRELLKRTLRLRAKSAPIGPSTEEMQREDRGR
jgi:plasmid stability protein